MSLADLINLAIAVFTAAAAIAAWVSTTASLKATEKANETSEESRKIAHEQTQALMLAAKANGLASRISFYSEQIRTLEKQLQDYQQRGWAQTQSKSPGRLSSKLEPRKTRVCVSGAWGNCAEQAEKSRILDIERLLPVWKSLDQPILTRRHFYPAWSSIRNLRDAWIV